jgi:hypothetical protein
MICYLPSQAENCMPSSLFFSQRRLVLRLLCPCAPAAPRGCCASCVPAAASRGCRALARARLLLPAAVARSCARGCCVPRLPRARARAATASRGCRGALVRARLLLPVAVARSRARGCCFPRPSRAQERGCCIPRPLRLSRAAAVPYLRLLRAHTRGGCALPSVAARSHARRLCPALRPLRAHARGGCAPPFGRCALTRAAAVPYLRPLRARARGGCALPSAAARSRARRLCPALCISSLLVVSLPRREVPDPYVRGNGPTHT